MGNPDHRAISLESQPQRGPATIRKNSTRKELFFRKARGEVRLALVGAYD